MVQGQRLQQCEFKKKNVMCTLIDESESTSSAEPVYKKLKPVSVLMSKKSKQQSYPTSSQFMKRKRIKESNIMQVNEHNEDGGPCHNIKYERFYEDDLKNERARDEPFSLSSNLIHMQSILEELRVARENMLVQLREEMQRIMDDEIPEQAEDYSERKETRQQNHNAVGSMFNHRNCKREV